MKRITVLIVFLVASLALAACSIAQSKAVSSTGTPGSEEMSEAMQLALGTLKLEKTQYPVDAAQASELLPLWKAARCLGKSDTTASEEETSLVKQIQNTMTAEQLKAIQEMKLTAQDLPSITQELGIQTGASVSANVSAASSGSSPASGGGPPADFGGGMPPDGGMGGAPSSSAQTTQPSGSTTGTFMGVDTAVLDEMIQFLEAKA